MGFLIVVQGATAVGKSGIAARLAAHYGVGVISADSRQFYSEMCIGTAVPGLEDLSLARHYFIQDRSVTSPLSAGGYERESLGLLSSLGVGVSGVIGVVVGGSGLYVDALLNGLDYAPRSESIRSELHDLYLRDGLGSLVEALRVADPAYYRIVDRSNPQRVLRALEVFRAGGVAYSSLRLGGSLASDRPFSVIRLIIDLPRDLLYSRIESRVDLMIERGLESEVSSLVSYRGLGVLQSVGYSEMFEYFDGLHSFDRCMCLIKQHSRNYAKRQLSWLRRGDCGEVSRFSPDNFSAIVSHVDSFL